MSEGQLNTTEEASLTSEDSETPPVSETPIKVTTAVTTAKNVEGSDTATATTEAEAETSPPVTSSVSKENILVVVGNKGDVGGNTVLANATLDGGEVKLVSKPLTVVGTSAGGATLVKKGAVVGKAAIPQTSPTKRNIVISTKTGGVGVSQIIGQQPSVGSTPVILTQKVPGSVGGAKIVAGNQQRAQDVRVDNWSTYCLQRLKVMYDQGEYCDLTIRFHSSQEIKVHRVVVNLCTEYFSNLEKRYGLVSGTLILPKDVDFQTMQTIIRFFYTGKLEVRGTQFNDIYRTVKMMNITILIKLLEAHSRKPVTSPIKKDAPRSVVLKQAVDLGLGKSQKGQVQIQVGAGQSQSSSSPVIAMSGSKALQVASPGMKLPPGVKTKTVLARVQGGKGINQGQKAAPKKLPIWKERKTLVAKPDPLPLPQIKEEKPGPTRFVWDDPDDDFFGQSPSMMNHAFMEKQKERQNSNRKAEDIFDSINQAQSGGKRSHPERSPTSSLTSSSSAPPLAKIPKLEAISSANQHTETIVPDITDETMPENALESSVNLDEDTFVEEVSTSPSTSAAIPTMVEKKPVPILKPALKLSGVDNKSKEGSPQKTVRFAPEVEKECEKSAPSSSPLAKPSQAPSSPSPTSTPSSPTSAPSTSKVEAPLVMSSDPSANHSKIISEVLRKFPDLVKDNKNIKLKIVQKTADSVAGSPKEGKSKISYIVLKSTGSSDTGTTLLKKSSTSTTSKFWGPDKAKPNPAENTTGPWLCEKCGEGEDTALQFDTYYNFRRHLVDVHSERIDARICEYCGQKSSKRNLLLYHLYTKHGVQPPKNAKFPHCDRCDYVALSESLLNKHKQNHDANKEYSCTICSASFKSSSALQSHMTSNLHRTKDTKVYECPYCRKPFVRNINLKAHIRALHRDVARIEEMDDPRLPADDSLTNRVLTHGGKRRTFPSILTPARSSSSTGMVEFVTADNLSGEVSYVTADGQPIEILDPSTLTSLPLTLVSAGEDGMAAVATTVGTTLNVDGQETASDETEYVTGVSQDPQAVYVMDGSQQAVEIDMANMGLTLASDGTMVYEEGGDHQSQNFIVQDMQGNQFRRITGIDETGKPVVFLQMMGENSQALLEESMPVDESGTSSQIFVSSADMQIPVTSDGSEGQVIFATAPTDGAILQMVSSDGSHQMVMSEAVLAAHGQHIEGQQQHLQLVQHPQSSNEMQEVIHDHMGQPVQELHIVLDQQETRSDEHVEQINEQTEGMEIVEVQQPEGFGELEYAETYNEGEVQQMEQDENEHSADVGTIETTEGETEEQEEAGTEEVETQQIEVDESSQQLQIDEGQLSQKSDVTQEIDIHDQVTQVLTGDNLQESIELVEGQTLTLIEDEDGTQRLKVGNENETNVEEDIGS